jgi:D-alanyl-D-alanine dipeptidase
MTWRSMTFLAALPDPSLRLHDNRRAPRGPAAGQAGTAGWADLNALLAGAALAASAFLGGLAIHSDARAFDSPAEAIAQGPIPAPPAAALRPLIGEYGVGEELLSIYEAGGQLHANGRGLDQVLLHADGTLQFTSTGTGTRAGPSALEKTRFAFHLDAVGDCDAVSVNGVPLPRRDVGAEAIAAIRSGLRTDPAALRAAALAMSPPVEPAPKKPMNLVPVGAVDPSIKFDIRYATTNNFMGFPLYDRPGAFLQRPAADALGRVAKALQAKGYGLLIYDAYRPWFVTRMFWDATPPKSRIFVADPAQGSRHNRGCAVDLTLYDLRSGEPAEMTSRYDEMSRRAYPDYVGGTSRQRWLRDLLRREMEQQGFEVYAAEWWHFDYDGWRDYGIGNLTFAALGQSTGD